MSRPLKDRKELVKLFYEAGTIITNHLLNSTNRKTWLNRTHRNFKIGEYWTSIYHFNVDAEDTVLFPHMFLYLLEEEADVLLTISIEFKRPLVLLNKGF